MAAQPDLDTFQEMTEAAYARLPDAFRKAAGRIAIHVQDFAEPDVLMELGIRDAYELTGLYQGIPLIHDSVTFPSRASFSTGSRSSPNSRPGPTLRWTNSLNMS